jgi:hypothetical protein
VTYRLKALDKGYKFALNIITIKGLHTKLCAPKVMGVPVVGISRFPLGSLGTKSHLDVAPMEKRKIYYKGEEGGGFPPSPNHGDSCVSELPVACPNTKSAPTMH